MFPGGIGHVYDSKHSYPMFNADIGMILRRVDFGSWVEGGQASQLWQNLSSTNAVTIDPSIAKWIEGSFGKYPDSLSYSENLAAVLYLRVAQVRTGFYCKISIYFT